MSRKPKKYHFIYRTTCTVTDKFYVGMHSSDSMDDGYLGSGKILGYSRKKYGDENHVREVLEHCSSRDELKQREKEIVNEELLANPLNINLKYGGDGGWDHIKDSPNYASQMLKAGKNGGFSNAHKWDPLKTLRAKKIWRECGLKTMTRMHTTRTAEFVEYRIKAADKAALAENVIKRKKTFAERKHMQGEKNSQFDTRWVTDGTKPIKIKRDDLAIYLAKGYCRGRKFNV